jgi:trigger factor
VLGEVIQSSFQEAVVSESLRPAGMPQILPLEDADLESGGFGYTATFEVFPEFELAPTNLIEIERPSAEVGEDDVDTMISNLRKQRATWSVVDREAVTGDQLIIDFTGTVEGEEFAGGSAENTALELGSATMIPGFEDQLIGVVAGGDKTVQVDFPDDYDNDELAGKPGEFAVHIHSVKQAELPELDNDFIKLFGVEQGGIEAFRKDIASNMKRELEQAIQNKVKHAIMEALSEANTVDIPNAMVSEEIGGMRKHMIEQMQIPEGGHAPELDDDLFRGEAERRVKLRLVVAEVIKVAELKASPQKVRETIEKLASSYQKPEQFVNYYYQNEELLQSVEMMVLEQAVTEWVVSQCKVTDKPATFQEVMNSASTV